MDESELVPGTEEFKKARRRRQNRESALRSRVYKKEQLESIQEKLERIDKINSKMEQEIKKLRVENDELRQEAVMNNKISFAYIKVAVVLSVSAMLVVQHFTSGTESSPNWLSSGIVGFLLIFLVINN